MLPPFSQGPAHAAPVLRAAREPRLRQRGQLPPRRHDPQAAQASRRRLPGTVHSGYNDTGYGSTG